MCSAHPRCAHLAGACCPTAAGIHLSCCESGAPVASLPPPPPLPLPPPPSPPPPSPLPPLASGSCSAHPRCAHLAGACCPTAAGIRLACCELGPDREPHARRLSVD